MTDKVFITWAAAVAIIWILLGIWIITNLLSATTKPTILAFNAFLAAWTLFTIIFLNLIIRKRIK